ncbi:MAG: hypothetical protein ACREGA_04085 [Candidatus Saccharimonadales bacterium]
MKQLTIILTVMALVGGIFSISLPTPASALSAAQDACQGVGTASGNSSGGASSSGAGAAASAGAGLGQTGSNGSSSGCTGSGINLSSVAKSIVNVLSIIVGIVAVIMIIVGGLKYVVSAGDAQAASGAKNTILYAIIGLIIAVLAQIIVHFVLNNLPGGS